MRSAFDGNVNQRLASVAEGVNVALLMRAQLAGVFHFDAPVGVLDDPDELQLEHLRVVICVIFGNDSRFRQNFLGNVMMALAGLALHAARDGSVRVKKIAVNWHPANMARNDPAGKGVT